MRRLRSGTIMKKPMGSSLKYAKYIRLRSTIGRIGFFIMVPDLNRLIGKYNGRFGIVNKLRMMWDLKVRKKCDRIFAIVFGITPEFQGKGVESGFMEAMLNNYIRTDKNDYRTVEFAWIGDFNPVMNRMVERYICARKHKMHTTYRYLFDRTKEFTRCPKVGFKPRPTSETPTQE